MWSQGGKALVVLGLTISNGRIVGIDLIADPDRLRQLELAILED